MRYFGLAGKKLGHSFSQKWFRNKFKREGIDADYLLFETEDIVKSFENIRRQHGIEGFNVTIPYKKEILKFCDYLSDEVISTGASNCIRLNRGYVEAFNTDTYGFRHLLSLAETKDPFHGAIILGTGGSAAAVLYVLNRQGIPSVNVSRAPGNKHTIGFSDITKDIVHDQTLIINTTPVGMWPEIEASPPFPYHLLTGKEILIDLIYNPETTAFMIEGAQKGCRVFNGLSMLEKQAERSWEIWNQ